MASDSSAKEYTFSLPCYLLLNSANCNEVPFSVSLDGRLWEVSFLPDKSNSLKILAHISFSMYITIQPELSSLQLINLTIQGLSFFSHRSFKLEEANKKDHKHGPFPISIPVFDRGKGRLIFKIERNFPVNESSIDVHKFEALSSAKFLNFTAQLFKNEVMSDVIVKVKGQDLPAHKIVLCAASSVFKAMFESSFRQTRSNVVEIEGSDPETINQMLKFIYTHKAPICKNVKVIFLYEVAHKFGMEHLLEICRHELSSTIGIANALDYLVLADKFEDVELKQKVLNFICENTPALSDVLKYQEIMRQRPSLLKDILDCKLKQI